MRTWWLIFANDKIMGAGETREIALNKTEGFIARMPEGYLVKGKGDIWINKDTGDFVKLVEVEEKHA